MLLPKPRGPLSDHVFAQLRSEDRSGLDHDLMPGDEDDAALTLWSLYELSYGGFEEVASDAEWDPGLLATRRRLEIALENRLHRRWEAGRDRLDTDGDLFSFVASHDGVSLARHVQRTLDRDQVLDYLKVRSIYHLKETDPVVWVAPRLPVRSKAALFELLYDEYGAGDPNRLHHHLFARGLEAVGLSAAYGEYVNDVPWEVLEQNNAMSLFGLHRRLRGAAVGHLAAFEVTSSMPCRRVVHGLERVGLAPEMAEYYAEHIEADAVHEQLAVRDICGSLVHDAPELAEDVRFGAFTCLDLEDRLARRLLQGWGVAA